MRKLFWGLTAVSVAAVGGMFWLKLQGPTLPFSFAATAAIQYCQHTQDGVLGTGGRVGGNLGGQDNGEDDLSAFQKPDEPVEVAEVKVPETDQGLTGAIEFTPSPVVPAITIREPMEVSKPVAVAGSPGSAVDLTTNPTEALVDPALLEANATAIGSAHGETQAAPRVMPYAPDDDPSLPMMDYPADDPIPVDDPDDDGPIDDDDPLSIWSWFFPTPAHAAAGHTTAERSAPACREDEHYHDQYSGLPYTGCPDTGRSHNPPPYVEPKKSAPPTVAPGGIEESSVEPPVLNRKASAKLLHEHLRKLRDNHPEGAAFPDIDTMEFRPSDHSAYEHLPNPI
jgi:hypothetical protein